MSDDKFSVGLRLNDLDDFITPSQSCVSPAKPSGGDQKRAKIELTEDGSYVEVDSSGKASALGAATISLADCLACSGCITSAESVLVSAQSAERFSALVSERVREGAPLVVSVSPQSVASLAARHGLDEGGAFGRLVSFFSRCYGAAAVVSTAAGVCVSIDRVAQEFCARYRTAQAAGGARAARRGALPLLASECPGWVCYAEKTHPETLPYIARAKSGMAVVGAMLKRRYGRACVHASVMPCYDKKLEASREDFCAPDGTRDVDIVLATSEVEELLRAQGVADLAHEPERAPAQLLGAEDLSRALVCESPAGRAASPAPAHAPTSGGGGYLWGVLRVAARELLGASGLDDPSVSVTETPGRNSDIREYTLRDAAGTQTLRFAHAYGFRNIQNIVRKIKMGTCNYDFVEIMACPNACLNGGGQIKPGKLDDSSEWIKRVKNVFDAQDPMDPEAHARIVESVFPDLSLDTEYHDRKDKKPASLTMIKW